MGLEGDQILKVLKRKAVKPPVSFLLTFLKLLPGPHKRKQTWMQMEFSKGSDISSPSYWSDSSVEVAKFWLKRTFSSKLLEKILKVNLWVEAEGEREKGGGEHSYIGKFSNKKHIFSTMNYTADEQFSPQGPRLWADTSDPSVLFVLS